MNTDVMLSTVIPPAYTTIDSKISNAYSINPHHLPQTNFNQCFRLVEFPWDFIDKISEMGNLIELIEGGSSPTASHDVSQNSDTLTSSHVLNFACNDIFKEPLDFVLFAGGHLGAVTTQMMSGKMVKKTGGHAKTCSAAQIILLAL